MDLLHEGLPTICSSWHLYTSGELEANQRPIKGTDQEN